jgi:hypothetical protein
MLILIFLMNEAVKNNMNSVIFKLLSLKCDLPNFAFLLRICVNPTGNTTKNRQNNAKFVSRDTGNARNDSTGQRAPIRVSLTSRASKTRYLEKFKINISTRRIHTKLSTRKRLNTKNILHIYPFRK